MARPEVQVRPYDEREATEPVGATTTVEEPHNGYLEPERNGTTNGHVLVPATGPSAADAETSLTRELDRRDGARVVSAIRRLLDLSIASVLIVLLSPLLLAIAVAIWIDSPGGAIFRQRRMGRGQRPFVMYKFRTMRPGGGGHLHREYVNRLINGDCEPQYNGRETIYKLAMEDQTTRVGRVLRRSSLDELPQLWNVVKGDMSLIGPRPVILHEVELYPARWCQRFEVKPGVTGLWQVSGRNLRTYLEMIEYDLEYVRRQSLWLDFVILARTVPTVLLRRGVC